MMRGVEAAVRMRSQGPRDALGNISWTHAAPVTVNVIVAPGACADLGDSRPEGVRVALTLHFPKDWGGGSLRGALIGLPAPWEGTYRVIGDPMPYSGPLTPFSWNMPVEVEAVDG